MKSLSLVEEKTLRIFTILWCITYLKKEKKKGFPGGSNGKESAGNGGDPVRSLGQEDPLEKGMATHSSILAWRISWIEEPDGI